MYSAFGDESSDQRCDRVFAIGSLFGDSDSWRDVATNWNKITNGEEFHASQWDVPERQQQYAELVGVLEQSRLLGWGTSISVEGLKATFPQAVEQFPYYYCFGRVILHFAKTARLCIPQAKVKFTFHQNLAVQQNASVLYRDLISYPEWKDREFVADEISYVSSKTVEVQAADLWVREIRKHTDNALSAERKPMRRFLAILRATKRFAFDVYERSFFESMKTNWSKWHRGTTEGEYAAWRRENKLRDSGSARIRFLVYLNAIQTQNMPMSPHQRNEKGEASS